MASVRFTPQLRRFTDTPEIDAPAATLRDALEAAFAANPRLRGYVLDDQGQVRPNVGDLHRRPALPGRHRAVRSAGARQRRLCDAGSFRRVTTMTADRAWVATRKGLFELKRGAGGWAIGGTAFLGEPVSMLLPPDDVAAACWRR